MQAISKRLLAVCRLYRSRLFRIELRFMPQHLRVVFMSSCAVVWGGYISYVVHR